MIANSCQLLCFAESLACTICSFFKQQNEQTISEPLQSHPIVCGFHTVYAAFHVFKFWREEITGVDHVDELSFIGNYM